MILKTFCTCKHTFNCLSSKWEEAGSEGQEKQHLCKTLCQTGFLMERLTDKQKSFCNSERFFRNPNRKSNLNDEPTLVNGLRVPCLAQGHLNTLIRCRLDRTRSLLITRQTHSTSQAQKSAVPFVDCNSYAGTMCAIKIIFYLHILSVQRVHIIAPPPSAEWYIISSCDCIIMYSS